MLETQEPNLKKVGMQTQVLPQNNQLEETPAVKASIKPLCRKFQSVRSKRLDELSSAVRFQPKLEQTPHPLAGYVKHNRFVVPDRRPPDRLIALRARCFSRKPRCSPERRSASSALGNFARRKPIALDRRTFHRSRWPLELRRLLRRG